MNATCMKAALPLRVRWAGAVTPVGYSLPATAAAIRAAVDRFEETHFIDAMGEAIIGARVRHVSEECEDRIVGGPAHLGQLLAYALDEALAPLPPERRNEVALLLLFPESERDLDHSRVAAASLSMAVECIGGLHPASRCFTQGSAGFASALAAARDILETNSASFALVAGVDSWLNASCIQQALEEERLLVSDAAAGFIPSEAAAAVLLERADASSSGVDVVGIGLTEEAATLRSGEPCYGLGLAAAIRAALAEAGLGVHEIHLRLADLAGEEYAFEESAYAFSRLQRAPSPPNAEQLLPATRTGDVGAAFGPLLLGYAWHLARIDRAPGANTLIHLGAGNLRAAVVVRFTPESAEIS